MSWHFPGGPTSDQAHLLILGQLAERSERQIALQDRQIEMLGRIEHHLEGLLEAQRSTAGAPRRTTWRTIRETLEFVQSLKTWVVWFLILLGLLMGLVAPQQAKSLLVNWAVQQAGPSGGGA